MPHETTPALQHRSMRRLRWRIARAAQAVAIAAGFNLLTWLAAGQLARAWSAFFTFWIDKLGLEASVEARATPAAVLRVLPHLELATRSPGASEVVWTLGFVLASSVIASRLPEALIPLRYLLVLAVVLQCTALLYFALPWSTPPYSTAGYLDGLLEVAGWLLVLVPWVHALVYHLFEFSLWRKIFATALTVSFLAVATPCEVMLHAWLLATGSVLWMPLLYFLGGASMLVFGCVSLYGFAMSWEHGSAAAAARAALRRLPEEGGQPEDRAEGGTGTAGGAVGSGSARVPDGSSERGGSSS